MKILMLSVTFPYPPSKGGTQVRTFNLLKYLQRDHRVTLLTQTRPDVSPEEISALREQVEELVVFPQPQIQVSSGIFAKLGRSIQSFSRGTPANVFYNYSPLMQDWIDRHLAKFDVVTCEHSVNEIYLTPNLPIPAVVDIHSSIYGTCRQQLATGTSVHPFRDRLNLPLLYNYERRYCEKFSSIVVTTSDDRAYLEKFALHTPLEVIPNGVDLAKFPLRDKDPGGYKLIFTGAMDTLPNIDAAQFLSRWILPGIQEIYPATTLELVGDRPVPEVLALAQLPGVVVTGKVPSMADSLHRGTICVIPLRTGLGIKNKTLEAMAAGIPVVGSNSALEGLRVDGDDVPLRALRANRISEYVAAISRLFADPSLRGELSKQGRSLIVTQFTWEIAGGRYEMVLSQSHRSQSTTKLPRLRD